MPQKSKSRTAISQPTIRVNAAAKRKLDQMQKQTDLSQPALLDIAIDLLEWDLLSRQAQADFAAIASDPKALALYKEVSSRFDGTSQDGIKRK